MWSKDAYFFNVIVVVGIERSVALPLEEGVRVVHGVEVRVGVVGVE